MSARAPAAVALALLAAACTYRTDATAPTPAARADLLEDVGLPPAPEPFVAGRRLTLANAPALDHRTQVLGLYCSSHRIEVQLASVVAERLAVYRRGAAPSSTPPQISVSAARSTIRCFEAGGDLRLRCIATVAINAELADGAARQPIAVDLERTTRGDALGCRQFGRVMAVMADYAAAELVVKADAALGRPAPAQTPSSAR